MNYTICSEPPKPCDFKVGDVVKFTNDYGAEFGPLVVRGFTTSEDELHGKFIYLNTDCHWFPVDPKSLKIWDRAVDGVTPERPFGVPYGTNATVEQFLNQFGAVKSITDGQRLLDDRDILLGGCPLDELSLKVVHPGQGLDFGLIGGYYTVREDHL